MERVRIDTSRVEEQAREIQSKIMLVAADLLEQDVVRERDMQVDNLAHKVQENFFATTGLILRDNLI